LSASSIGAPPRASLDVADAILAGSQRLHDPFIPSPGRAEDHVDASADQAVDNDVDALEAMAVLCRHDDGDADDHQTGVVSRRLMPWPSASTT
jgi:hypothetical protein